MYTLYFYSCTNCKERVKSVVELKSCPYCGFAGWWSKKEKIGQEEPQGWQDKVIEPRKKMTKEEILKKVESFEKKVEFIRRCLVVRVCPGCGCTISNSTPIDQFYTCECGFNRAFEEVRT